MSTVIPPRIRPGETLGVIAPAGPVNVQRLQRGLARLGDTFKIRIADGILAERSASVPSYLAASDAARIAELEAMLADPDVRAIILARGGYGLMRILPHVDASLLRRDPKPIVGFSDATALLAWAWTAAGVRGIHGPMVQQLADLPDEQVAHLITLLTVPRPPGTRPWRLAVHGGGTGSHAGHLIAANLTLASMLVGTPWPLPLAGAVVLLEEIGERPYELDRYLTQLMLTKALDDCAGVVLGELTRCEDRAPPNGAVDPPDAALQVFIERIGALKKPLASGAPVGHGLVNEAVPFGARCELDLQAGTLTAIESAVH